MMTNMDLVEQAIKNHIPLVDVFSKDKIPKLQLMGGYIFNMSDTYDEQGQSLPGTHWVCAYLEKDKQGKAKCIYFDSFGFGPPISIQNFLSPMSPYPYNNDDIQNINSGWCGAYCLYVIWFLSRHKSKFPNLEQRYKILLKQFKDDPEKNLSLLKKYMKQFKEK